MTEKTGDMKKRKNKCNRQSRREIIADVKRREAEWRKKRRKERWRICKSHIMLWGIFIIFISFFPLLVFVTESDIRNTFTNIILGLIAINGWIYLFMYLLFKAARNLTTRISLKNGESTGNAQWLPDSSGIPVEPEYLSRCDDKQIVIDNDGISVRMVSFLVCLFIFLVSVCAGLTPSNLTTKDYGSILLLLEMYLIILTLWISAILQPWRRIVFDRVSKTVTIPGRLLLHKKETIPYSQAELTIRYYRRGSWVAPDIIISNANSSSLLSGVSLMPGDLDKVRRFARFIQLYMEREELPDIPEFEKYRSKVNV